jgi:hypothetical protein
MRLFFATTVSCVSAILLLLVGCDSRDTVDLADEEQVEVAIRTPDPLKLVAIGMPDFGAEVARQWSARRDGELTIEHVTIEDFANSSDSIVEADLVVHPVSLTVDLVSKELIRPVPKKVWTDEELNRDGMLRHYRKSLVRHDDQLWSISLGGKQLFLLYRQDLLEKYQVKVPKTWSDLSEAIAKLEGRKDELAASVRDQGKLTTFFDRKTMQPMISAAPFVKALDDMRRLASFSESRLSPADAFKKFATGESVFAITFPAMYPGGEVPDFEEASDSWGIECLPGDAEVYDMKEARWERRPKQQRNRVDTFGLNAANVSVTASTSNANDAFEFATWLVSKEMSESLLSGLTGPFRATHLARLGKWSGVDQLGRDFVERYTDAIRETHDSELVFIFPQIPGKQQYLDAINEAVVEFVGDDKADAKSSLEKLGERWEAITESLGRKEQVAQLRKSSGF